MTSDDTKRAAIYARISRADRADTGETTTDNVDRQERECREYARQQGWTVTQVFTDNDISGGKDDRGGFAELTKAVDEKLVDVVLATESSRFTRSDDSLFLFKFAVQCNKNDVQLWTKKTGLYDVSNDNAEVMMFFEGFMSKQERKATADRQRRKRRDLSMQGQPLPGKHVPFGWKDKRMQVVDPEQARWVKKMFEKWNTGTGLYPLAQMLNDNGMRKSTGRVFGIKDVRYMLQNEKYCGWVIRDGETLTTNGKWKTIIDSQTFEVAQKKFETKTAPLQRGNKPKRLLSGKLACLGELDGEPCLTTMVMNGDLYRCTPASYGCGKNSINIYKLENYIIHEVVKPLMELLPENTSDPVDHSADIAAIDGKLSRLKFLYAEGDMATDEYTAERNKLRVQREQYISESATAVPVVGSFEKFLNADIHAQRELLNLLIPDKIRVRPNITGKHALDPNRIDINYLT